MSQKPTSLDSQLQPLLGSLGELIRLARQRVLRAVDTIQVQTGWEIGRHIVEFEQGGEARAAYGKRLLPTLASVLGAEFGKGFDERNLRHMRTFYQQFPIWNAVRTELSWTHYRTLLKVDSDSARQCSTVVHARSYRAELDHACPGAPDRQALNPFFIYPGGHEHKPLGPAGF